MTKSQRIWAAARDRLGEALESLGYPGELAGILAGQLKSPRAVDRMTSYLYQARPGSMEQIADEMLAICAEIDAWREKKENRKAMEDYNEWLGSESRRRIGDEP